MSKSEIALIKKLYATIQVLDKKIDNLTKDLAEARKEISDIKFYKIIETPANPIQPLTPIGPYFNNPIPKRTFPDYLGPRMQDKIYAESNKP